MTALPTDQGERSGRSADDLALADRLGAELIRLIRLLERTKPVPELPAALERAHYLLLSRLVLDGPRRSRDLAEAVHSDPSTVSRQVGNLVSHGLVRREPDPDDGRASRLAATAEGEALFARMRRARNEHLARLLAGWSVADRERLIELLARFGAGIEDYKTQHAEPASAARLRGER
jgi:DNA-binding MarR family transcriptional regulator